MSHVTSDTQREENSAINDCKYRGQRWQMVEEIDDWTGEVVHEFKLVEFNHCGPFKTLSAAQDKCARCGKVFTY